MTTLQRHPHLLLRRTGAALLAAHGAVHLLGVALLWRLAEPGGLSYDDVLPTFGPLARAVAGAAWLATAVILAGAAALLLAGRPAWRGTAALGAAASVSVLLPAATAVPAGLVLDALLLGVLAVLTLRTAQEADADLQR